VSSTRAESICCGRESSGFKRSADERPRLSTWALRARLEEAAMLRRVSLPPHRDVPQRRQQEATAQLLRRRAADHDRAGLGCRLQPGGDVHGVAEGYGMAFRPANHPDCDLSAVDTDADARSGSCQVFRTSFA
jgi:hypothetical protein